MALILGIETSCDETGIGVVRDGRDLIVNDVASQVAIHAVYGGVVPEIASRHHTEIITQIVQGALAKIDTRPDAIAATIGPGLMGSLLVGVSFAKALAFTWDVPFVPVHHIEGHLFSAFLGESPPDYPYLALVVSGGHTQLILGRAPHDYTILGTTRDDAVGESFDKVARLLGLPYPGGPSIQKAAETGNPKAVAFPRALSGSGKLEFSYSGLKTAVLYEVRRRWQARGAQTLEPHEVADLAASFQEAAVDILLIKVKEALLRTGVPHISVVGGVAANRLLRTRLAQELHVPVSMPPMALCVDNGAMIAAAGESLLAHGRIGDMTATPHPNLPLVKH
jgi:N6-L-threonylcarbamoyladenine synthase